MKTPSFWNEKNLLSTLLLPLASLYDTASLLSRAARRPVTLAVPVICIGNLTMGGSGKTPVALHVGRMLKDKKIAAFYVSRGYGGRLKGPVRVNAQKHSAEEVGDEPLLLAGVLPTVVAKDRLQGALYAMQKGAKVIVMDDGFQNNAIAKSLSLLVVDGSVGFGNGRIFPAGPLREDPALGLARAHAVVVINRTTRVPAFPAEKPVLLARTQPKDDTLALKGKKLAAFCGLAYPHKFFDMLSSLGALVVEKTAFADHHPYTASDMRKLMARANPKQAALITTAKDFVRIPQEYRECVAVLDMELAFDNEPLLAGILDYILTPHENA